MSDGENVGIPHTYAAVTAFLGKDGEFLMKAVSLAAALAALVAVPACGPDVSKQDSGTVVGAIAGGVIGNQFGQGGGRVAATLAGAVVGGIVGNEIGRSLDARDRELARQAELDAWERGSSGRPVRWRNPDNGRYGEVIPDAPYKRGGNDCRDYTHRVYIDGRPQAMRGTACRNPDGTWTPVA
jgi:surface antigen